MKQLSLYIFLLLLAVACYDDLGNYDYTELLIAFVPIGMKNIHMRIP